MIDYPAARAVATVVRTGSFERAAEALGVTPSAVSQRVRQLEERLGAVLIVRGSPCTATERGERLCRHMERVGLLERELIDLMPGLVDPSAPAQRPTIAVAANADSLGTWFLAAIAAFARRSDLLLDVTLDDEGHTADRLRRGRVSAAVTSLAEPVQGCRVVSLGALRYRATASPDYVARHFPDGVTPEAIARAPALTFGQKDRLQHDWIRRTVGRPVPHPTHWLPSTQSFVEAGLAGMGWSLNPEALVRDHLSAGRLVELVRGAVFDVPLHWQIDRASADRLSELTADVVATAARALVRVA